MSERPTAEELSAIRRVLDNPRLEMMNRYTIGQLFAELDARQAENRALTLERDQLREQCAYNQLQLEAMAAKLAKADRMDQ